MVSWADFFKLFNNTKVDFDGYYGDQCVDLVQFWATAIGSPHFTGNAINIYDQPGTFYTQVANTADNFPAQGDVVVFSAPYGRITNPDGSVTFVGHVGLCTGNNTDSSNCELLEQNDPTGSGAHIQSYNYAHIVGWLHPKIDLNAPPASVPAIINDQTKIDLGGTIGVLEVQAIRSKLTDDQNSISTLNTAVANTHQQYLDAFVQLGDTQQKLLVANAALLQCQQQKPPVVDNLKIDMTNSFASWLVRYLQKYYPAKPLP